jgi:hypothetical protein
MLHSIPGPDDLLSPSMLVWSGTPQSETDTNAKE